MHDDLIVAVVVLIRLGLPLAIARYPLPALLGCLVIDAIDQTIFQTFTDRDLSGYQIYDKALDVWYLTIAYLSTIRNWAGGPDFNVGRCLWYYRLVGVAIFEYSNASWVLLAFPNTFEYYFIAIEWFKVRRDPNRLTARQTVTTAAVIWVVIKLPQEWWIHVAHLDFTDVLKERVLRASPSASWNDAISGRPLAAIGLVVVAVAIGIGITIATRVLPASAWPATFDADRQGEQMGWRAPRPEAHPRAFFGWAFAEKVVLVTMVSLIFARILPGAPTQLTAVVLLTTYLIAVNTVLSQLLARRGTSWRNTAVQCAWMAVANFGVLIGSTALLGRRDSSTPLSTTMFLVGLLTLIVVLYDRSHGVYADLQLQRITTGRSGAPQTASRR